MLRHNCQRMFSAGKKGRFTQSFASSNSSRIQVDDPSEKLLFWASPKELRLRADHRFQWTGTLLHPLSRHIYTNGSTTPILSVKQPPNATAGLSHSLPADTLMHLVTRSRLDVRSTPRLVLLDTTWRTITCIWLHMRLHTKYRTQSALLSVSA